MLTTTDNPYDPFTNYAEWLAYDEGRGYYTNNYLARVAFTSNELSEVDQNLAIQDAIDEIIERNLLGLYIKTYQDESKTN